MYRSIILAAAGIALASPAYAACPSGYVPGYENVGGVATPVCITPVTTGEDASISGVIVDGDVVKNDAEGDPQHISEQGPSPTFVFGPNGLAAGNGARVGTGHLEEASCSKGKPKKGLFGWGCADEKGDWPKDAKYTPAHWIADKPVSNGTAVGAGAVVEHDNSTALGAGARSTDTNQVTLGTKAETISAPGITSQLSKDRQIGSLELVTTDSEGRLASDGGAVFARLNAYEGKLEQHAKGIAIAMSLPDAWIESNKRFAIAGSVGGFDGETALGAAAILRLDDVWSVNGKLGSDTSFEEFGWQLGARASW